MVIRTMLEQWFSSWAEGRRRGPRESRTGHRKRLLKLNHTLGVVICRYSEKSSA